LTFFAFLSACPRRRPVRVESSGSRYASSSPVPAAAWGDSGAGVRRTGGGALAGRALPVPVFSAEGEGVSRASRTWWSRCATRSTVAWPTAMTGSGDRRRGSTTPPASSAETALQVGRITSSRTGTSRPRAAESGRTASRSTMGRSSRRPPSGCGTSSSRRSGPTSGRTSPERSRMLRTRRRETVADPISDLRDLRDRIGHHHRIWPLPCAQRRPAARRRRLHRPRAAQLHPGQHHRHDRHCGLPTHWLRVLTPTAAARTPKDPQPSGQGVLLSAGPVTRPSRRPRVTGIFAVAIGD
jgi:hypothetical protein